MAQPAIIILPDTGGTVHITQVPYAQGAVTEGTYYFPYAFPAEKFIFAKFEINARVREWYDGDEPPEQWTPQHYTSIHNPVDEHDNHAYMYAEYHPTGVPAIQHFEREVISITVFFEVDPEYHAGLILRDSIDGIILRDYSGTILRDINQLGG